MNFFLHVLFYFQEHLLIVTSAMLVGILIGLPSSLILYGLFPKRPWIKTLFSKLSIISPLAVLALLNIHLGFSFIATFTLLIYFNVSAIMSSTLTAFYGMNKNILNSCKSLGLSKRTQLIEVQLPIALPDFIAGIKTGVLQSITIVAMASFLTSGGLGDLLRKGLHDHDSSFLVATGLSLIFLCLTADTLFNYIEVKARNYLLVKRFRNMLPFFLVLLIIVNVMGWLTEYYSHLSFLKTSIN